MEYKVKGTIKEILPMQEGTAKNGNAWKKQLFTVETTGQYKDVLCFESFGSGEKVDNPDKVAKYNKQGDNVEVSFNIKCNEWEGKYFTSLASWRIDKVEGATSNPHAPSIDPADPDGLPF